MIKILLIGGGAREHAIARAIKRSIQANALYCFASNNNPGILKLCEQYKVGKLNQIDELIKFATVNKIDFALIGPEAALALGIVDILEENGISCIGPTKKLAQIETSKGFARNLLKSFNLPYFPKYKVFSDLIGVEKFLNELNNNFVVKADGLVGGKGVQISDEHLKNQTDAIIFCKELLSMNHNIVIEEKLEGQEFSLLSFSDGKYASRMPIVQDHKRAYENDMGPNTGGMGSYSNNNHSLPFLSLEDVKEAQDLNQRIIEILNLEFNYPYKGILYGGFIKTENGIKLLEYNARFGDPEAINILPLLETDFIQICQSIIEGNLRNLPVNFANKATVCKYLAPAGYPDNPIYDTEIDINQVDDEERLYYSSVNYKNGKLYTTTSRAIAVLGIAPTIKEAENFAETTIQKINGKLFYRKDIGKIKYINSKISYMNNLCNTNYPIFGEPLNIAVLASGFGSILPKLIMLLKEKQIPADINLIICNKLNAPVIELGKLLKIETIYEESEKMILNILEKHEIDLILLDGYMKILSDEFVQYFENKILNVHPSLLPLFDGLMDLQVHQAVIESGNKETGCTIHFVNEIVDGGPIIVQKRCEVLLSDKPETLKRRVQSLESEAFVEAIQKIINEN